MKYLDRPFDVKAVKDNGTFGGYASVFGKLDQGGDIVMPGAFTESLAQHAAKGRKVPILWQHRAGAPIGVHAAIVEDDHGLRIDGELNLEVQQGREAYALLKQGAISGISIGYDIVEDSFDHKTGIRSLMRVKLWENSLVTFPMLDDARVDSVKSIEQLVTLSECEDRLRDAGLSRSEALALVSRIKAIGRSDSEGAAISKALAILTA